MTIHRSKLSLVHLTLCVALSSFLFACASDIEDVEEQLDYSSPPPNDDEDQDDESEENSDVSTGLTVSAGSINVTVTIGDGNPANRDIDVMNNSLEPLSYQCELLNGGDAPILNISAQAGVLAAQETAVVSIAWDHTALMMGTYQSTIRCSNQIDTSDSQNIVVTYRILSEAIQRYWVGGSGNWSDSTHWSESSGGPGGASVPGEASVAHLLGNATVTLDADISVRGLICDGATISTSVERELAVSVDGVDVVDCGLPAANGGNHYLLGFRFTSDGFFDHIQGEVGGTSIAYLDADGNTVILRPADAGHIGVDLNVHHLDLGAGGAITVDCFLTDNNCASRTRVEVHYNAAHGCEIADVLGTGSLSLLGIEHENIGCNPGLLSAAYQLSGNVYDITGGSRVFQFVPVNSPFEVNAPMVLEKASEVLFNGQVINNQRRFMVGNDLLSGVAIARLQGAEITTAEYVRLEDTDGAILDFVGGGSVRATGAPQNANFGTDLFVANGGQDNGNNCQSQANPCASVNRCIQQANALGARAECLLNRGDTFNEKGQGTLTTIREEIYFATYGAGNDPVVLLDIGDQVTAESEIRIYAQHWRAE